MNKGILILLAVASAFVGYKVLLSESGAVDTYQRFCEEMVNGRYDRAEKLVAADLHAQLAGYKDGMSRCRRNGQLMGTRYDKVADKAMGGGKRRVELSQVVSWDPPGTHSAMGAIKVHHLHRAVLQEQAGQWRIVSFEDQVVQVRDWRGRDADDMRRAYSPS